MGPEGDTYTSVSGLDLDAPQPQPEGPALIARAGFNIRIYIHTAPGGNYPPWPVETSPVRGEGGGGMRKEERRMSYFHRVQGPAYQSLNVDLHMC